LVTALAHNDVPTRYQAANALARISELAAAAVPALVAAALSDDDPWVRVNAAYALPRIGQPAAAAVPTLVEALSDDDPRVRGDAAMALGWIGGLAATAVPALVAAAHNESDNELRRHIAQAIEEIMAGTARAKRDAEAAAEAAWGAGRPALL